MKIVVSSTGPGLNDAVDPRFGRAAFLIICDADTEKVVEVIENREGRDAGQGAGINVAALVAQKGVEIVLTGRVGPKALAVLDKAGIKVVDGAQGKVQEALADLLARRRSASSVRPASTGEQPEPRGGGGQRRKRGQGPRGGAGMRHGGRGRGRSTA